MATPGMLQSGLSHSLFEKWCYNHKNGLLLTGYCVENTLARDLINGIREYKGIDIKMSIDYISFSAHCDFKETSYFIK